MSDHGMDIDIRAYEVYGDVALSVQAGSLHHCHPLVDDLPIEQYDSVEVGLIYDGRLVLPSKVGLRNFDFLFEAGGPVGAFVSQDMLNELRTALKERQGLQEQ